MVKVREAARSDNAGLLSLTSLTSMDGRISIRIDRRPDFFRLLDLRGDGRVIVAEEDGRIVGCLSVAKVLVHVDGRPESVHYLGDLKTHPDYRGTGLAFRMIQSMRRYLVSVDADLVIFTAAYGNRNVRPFIEGRAGLPRAEPLGLFRVCQILPSAGRPRTGVLSIQEEAGHPDMYQLYQDHSQAYQFGPVYTPDSLRGAQHLVARSGKQILAALSLVDVGHAKQNVLIRLPFGLHVVVTILRSLHRFFPIAELPENGAPIHIKYVKAWACRQNEEKALDLLIQRARNVCFEQKDHFLAVAVHEKDPLRILLSRFPKFTFKSLGFVVNLKRGVDEMRRLTERIPYEDYSLV